MPEIVVQTDIGGTTIALTADVPAHQMLDMLDQFRRAVSIQRAQQQLVECIVDEAACEDALAASPAKEAEYVRERTLARIRLTEGWAAEHAVAKPRVEFELSRTHRQGLAAFDAETRAKVVEFAADREQVRASLPVKRAQIARQRAIIAGRERWEVVAERERPQADAAD